MSMVCVVSGAISPGDAMGGNVRRVPLEAPRGRRSGGSIRLALGAATATSVGANSGFVVVSTG